MKILLAFIKYCLLGLLGLVALYLLLTYVFKWNPLRAHSRDYSSSIKDSQEKGVFIAEYKLPNEILILKDTTNLYIDKAWLQKSWYYNSWSKPVIKYGYIELVILFDKNSTNYLNDEGLSIKFGKGNRAFSHINSFQGASITTKSIYETDTLNIYITKFKYKEKTDDTLSSFILVKKK